MYEAAGFLDRRFPSAQLVWALACGVFLTGGCSREEATAQSPNNSPKTSEEIAADLDKEMTDFWLGKTMAFPSDRAKDAAARLEAGGGKGYQAVRQLREKYVGFLGVAEREAEKEGRIERRATGIVYKDLKVQALAVLSGWIEALEGRCKAKMTP